MPPGPMPSKASVRPAEISGQATSSCGPAGGGLPTYRTGIVFRSLANTSFQVPDWSNGGRAPGRCTDTDVPATAPSGGRLVAPVFADKPWANSCVSKRWAPQAQMHPPRATRQHQRAQDWIDSTRARSGYLETMFLGRRDGHLCCGSDDGPTGPRAAIRRQKACSCTPAGTATRAGRYDEHQSPALAAARLD
jgi:hypothetical protein